MSRPDLRVSDIERDRTGELLREAYADGRLTLDEFNERMESALAAKTRGDLAGLTRDLVPESGGQVIRAHQQSTTDRTKRRLVSILGNSRQSGAWDPPGEVDAVAVLGDVLIDLRQADLINGRLDVQANAVLGNITVLVRPGTRVVLDGLDLLSNKEIHRHDGAAPSNGDIVHVHGNLILSNIKIANDESDFENPVWRHLKRHRHRRH